MRLILLSVTLPFIGQVDLNGLLFAVFTLSFLGVLAFEFVNGFHDTANAVATVIYTKTLKPFVAILWSGFWNFLGVFVIGTAVAMSLLKLVPLEKLVTLPIQVGACMVIAILLSSIIWNLGTWYRGIPLSSSHTLVGAMVGATLAFTHYYGGEGVNWDKAKDIALSLLVSPIIGFTGAMLLMQLEQKTIKSKRLFHVPEGENDKPPLPVRALLVVTCTLVSFFHGSNDGQKGVGLMMLVLITFLPMTFALNTAVSDRKILDTVNHVGQSLNKALPPDPETQKTVAQIKADINKVKPVIEHGQTKNKQQKFKLKKELQQLTAAVKGLTEKDGKLPTLVKKSLERDYKDLEKVTDFAPLWVLGAISLSLGLGTMIGWKRIVVTIGEKIGNQNLNYGQGATAEVVAAATIGISTAFGLPVSTTHVLSSGVAGAMVTSGGTNNLNKGTLRNIAMAWVFTLPAAVLLAFVLFMLLHLLL